MTEVYAGNYDDIPYYLTYPGYPISKTFYYIIIDDKTSYKEDWKLRESAYANKKQLLLARNKMKILFTFND